MSVLRYLFISFLCLYLFQSEVLSQHKVDNYDIVFSKIENGNAAIGVICEFDLILTELLSKENEIILNFGGQMPEYSVSELKINSTPAIEYEYLAKEKKLVFKVSNISDTTIHVSMSYVFSSLTVAFIYRNVAEFWETSYSEYYYPFVFGQKASFNVSIIVPDTSIVISNYSRYSLSSKKNKYIYVFKTTVPAVSHSVTFGILPSNNYCFETDTINNFPIEIYKLKSIEIPEIRIKELKDITISAINYFSTVFSTPYSENNIENKLTYAFHKNSFSNRNNGNFIIASQSKVATKPHILPIVHEIGHRWLGEWTMLIQDGQPAAYFIKESLNEYLELMFAKDYYGIKYFDSLITEEYLSPYNKIKNTSKDTSLYSMKYNNNNTVVYKKGVLIINEVVNKIGEEAWLDFIKVFYVEKRNSPDLTYRDFIDMFSIYDKDAGVYLDKMIKANGCPF